MSQVLSRGDLIAKNKVRRYKCVDLPTGGSVRIQSLTERERSEYETEMLKDTSGGKKSRASRKAQDGRLQIDRKALQAARLRLIVRCLVDDQGVRLFKDDEWELLEEMDGADTGAIGDACDALIGADDSYFEEILGNSEKVHAVDSQ